jgi:hypothetical protein
MKKPPGQTGRFLLVQDFACDARKRAAAAHLTENLDMKQLDQIGAD